MNIIVQKFGGTSVADTDRIKHVAEIIKLELKKGNKLIVVVSAMSGVTNRLVGYTNDISPTHNSDEKLAEYDAVLSSGEMITSGLLALSLLENNIKARSVKSWQVPIVTEGFHSKAKIKQIDKEKVLVLLESYDVLIIPGFQGVMEETNRISTLGRGGSDTSAVALAAALNAKRCDIYTDVNGVYTTDPRIVKNARKLNKIAYEEMLEMASTGAKVLHSSSVEFAMRNNVKLQVLSSFIDFNNKDEVKNNGTIVTNNEAEIMQRRIVTGLTYDQNVAQITIMNIKNSVGMAAKCFASLAEAGINVDMIVQNISAKEKMADITFTTELRDVNRAIDALKASEIDFDEIITDEDVVKISLIGVGMKNNTGVAAKMFDILSNIGANIIVISTSEIKISVLIPSSYKELSLRQLHKQFELE